MPEIAAELPPADSPQKALPAMSFLEHLEELRRRLIYSIIAMVVGFFACWGYAENIFSLMERPIMEALRRNGLSEKLVYLSPTEPFNLYLKIGFMAGIFVAAPFILYQVWMFISPGLYRSEKRYVLPFMVSTIGLFMAGGYFGYRLVYPAALDFLIGYGKQFQPMITIGEYTDLISDCHSRPGRGLRVADFGFLSGIDGGCVCRVDVAQRALFDSGYFYHCSHHYSYD